MAIGKEQRAEDGYRKRKSIRIKGYLTMDHLAMAEGWDPSFEDSRCGGEVMELGLNGPEAIPMVMKFRPSRPLQGSFALADDGIRDQEAAPSWRYLLTVALRLSVLVPTRVCPGAASCTVVTDDR